MHGYRAVVIENSDGEGTPYATRMQANYQRFHNIALGDAVPLVAVVVERVRPCEKLRRGDNRCRRHTIIQRAHLAPAKIGLAQA